MQQDCRFHLVVAELPRLHRYALALTRDKERAEDLVQECVLRACANFDRWQPGTNLTGWLMTIMHNLFINDVTKKRIQGVNAPAKLDQLRQPGNRQEEWHQLRDVSRAYGRLRPFQQQVIWLACVEEQDFRDISRQLHISAATVRSRLFRARESLRQKLEDGSETAGAGRAVSPAEP